MTNHFAFPGATLLPERADHSGGQQERPAQRSDDHPRAAEDEAGTGEDRTGQGDRRSDWRLRLPRVLGQDQGCE